MSETIFPGVAVFMIDGFDIDYYYGSEMPVMKHMARQGFFKTGSCIFPSLTNANNISIACGSWPDQHGVTTNCYFDKLSGQARFLEDASFLKTPTLFERAARAGIGSALLTCKSKTTKILGQDATLAIAAEEPPEDICQRYGPPPPMYSAEINYWLMDIALDLVETRPDLKLIYVHTTDYPMHMWPPEAPESQTHMRTIDTYLGRFHNRAPDFAMAVTADHGMNAKKRCWDLAKACRNRDMPLRFAVSPVADRLLKHHGGFGGVAYVYLNAPADQTRAVETLLGLEGVEAVLDNATAARRFSLAAARIGDLVVLPDRDTVFGDLPEESAILPPGYRSHGSLYEMEIPLLVYNADGASPRYRDINYNLDITRYLFDFLD